MFLSSKRKIKKLLKIIFRYFIVHLFPKWKFDGFFVCETIIGVHRALVNNADFMRLGVVNLSSCNEAFQISKPDPEPIQQKHN